MASARPWLLLAASGAWLWWQNSRRFELRGKTVIITGGYRGLGLELARRFAAEGARLALLARSPEGLEGARRELTGRGAEVRVFPCDVRDREAVAKTVGEILAAYGRIDVLVNNAGVIQAGPFENQDLGDFEEAMAVHAWGPLYLVRAVAPLMRRQGGGRIVNITSIGGLVAVPHLLPYCMSKFALVGLSDGLRAELAKDGIRVTTVAPGLMRTGSHWNALMKGKHRQEFAWFALADALPLTSTSSSHAARCIVGACRRGQARLIITPQAKLLHTVNALFPAAVAAGEKLVVRLLPGPAGPAGHRRRSGKESTSPLVPSLLTRLADRAALRNREI